MKIIDRVTFDDTDLEVTMRHWKEEERHNAAPHRVSLTVTTASADEDANPPILFTASTRGPDLIKAADLVVEELQKWLGKLSQIHDTAVRMRRMLEREEGGK